MEILYLFAVVVAGAMLVLLTPSLPRIFRDAKLRMSDALTSFIEWIEESEAEYARIMDRRLAVIDARTDISQEEKEALKHQILYMTYSDRAHSRIEMM